MLDELLLCALLVVLLCVLLVVVILRTTTTCAGLFCRRRCARLSLVGDVLLSIFHCVLLVSPVVLGRSLVPCLLLEVSIVWGRGPAAVRMLRLAAVHLDAAVVSCPAFDCGSVSENRW